MNLNKQLAKLIAMTMKKTKDIKNLKKNLKTLMSSTKEIIHTRRELTNLAIWTKQKSKIYSISNKMRKALKTFKRKKTKI